MPISCAFFWAAAEAISAARRLRTGSERVAESDILRLWISDLNSIELDMVSKITMDM